MNVVNAVSVVARTEPLAVQSGFVVTFSPGFRRKRLHPGYTLRGCVASVKKMHKIYPIT